MTSSQHTPLSQALRSALDRTGARHALRFHGQDWSGHDLLRHAQTFQKLFEHLPPGTRIAFIPSAPQNFIPTIIAALEQGLTIALPGMRQAPEDLQPLLDIGATVHPDLALLSTHPTTQPHTPDVAFLLKSSGTTGTHDAFVALSAHNIAAVLDSHTPHMDLAHARVLSSLPWHHAFGLVLDMMATLHQGGTLVRTAPPNPERWHHQAITHHITHCHMVPLVAWHLTQDPQSKPLLHNLTGGIVGGAPINAPLADALQGTNLRVGYGQTEAAPGITLGQPGHWRPFDIGHPLGCDAWIDDTGQLCIIGPNACLGWWRGGRLERRDPSAPLRTGDIVAHNPQTQTLTFLGRADHRFKLRNGRMVNTPGLEARLRQALRTQAIIIPDTDRALVTLWHDPKTPKPDFDSALMGGVPHAVHQLTGPMPTTPKGEPDRKAIARRLKATHNAETRTHG